METELDLSDALDSLHYRLHRALAALLSALLANLVLSRDLMNLNLEIYDYDNRVNALNHDLLCALEFLARLDGLRLRAQFFEAQVDVLENHAKRKVDLAHSRQPSTNDIRDNVLDWRTTETTLDNLQREFAHLKRHYTQLALTTPSPQVVSPVLARVPFSPPINERANRHISSLLTLTQVSSVFDDTGLRPLRCSSKKSKRLSTATLGNLSEVPLSPETEENISLETTDISSRNLFDTTVLHHTKRLLLTPSLQALVAECYEGDLLEKPKQKQLKHFKSCQGLQIGFNTEFRFPQTPSQPTTELTRLPMRTQSTADTQRQTIQWLTKIQENKQDFMPSKRRGLVVADVEAISTTFSAQKKTQLLLLDMMKGQEAREEQLRKELRATGTLKDRLRGFEGGWFWGGLTKQQNSSDNVPANSPSVHSANTKDSTETITYGNSENIHSERKQWGEMLSRLLNNATFGTIFDKNEADQTAEEGEESDSTVEVEPDHSQIYGDLQQALNTDLLLTV